MPYFVIPGDPDPSKEVAAEILRRHRHEERQQKEPWLASLLSSLIHKLFRPHPQNRTHQSGPSPESANPSAAAQGHAAARSH